MLTNSIPDTLQILFLEGGDYWNISMIAVGLKSLLPKVRKQVYLNDFAIDQNDLITVIEHSYNTDELILWSCTIGTLDEKFTISSDIDFKITYLDLFWTARSTFASYLDHEKAEIFFKALAKTKLKETLNMLHVHQMFFYGPKIQEICDHNGFEIKVVANHSPLFPDK